VTAVAYDAAGNSTSSSVTVNVSNGAAPPASDSTPPSVSIASPTGGNVDGIVTVAVNAVDNVGVARVDLKVNGGVVATTTTSPYRLSWDTSSYANGAATLTAVAYDAAGNVATSAAVTVNVAHPPPTSGDSTPPVVRIAAPVAGALVSGTVNVSASASDNVSTSLTLALLIDGVQKAKATGGSISYNWNTKRIAPGSHTVTVTARDAAGNVGSQSVTVTRK